MIRTLVFLFCCAFVAGAQDFETPQLALIDVHHQQIRDRANLKSARDQFKVEYESDVKSASYNFSKFVRGFVKNLFEDANQRFKLDDVALILLGSVARDEASPYTDFECLFLIKKDTVQIRRKCHLVMQYMVDRLYLAGEGFESGYDGFFCDKGNFTPLYNPWFYRYSNPGSLVASGQWQGRREMIMTPDKLKSYFALQTFFDYTDKTHKTVPMPELFKHLNDLGGSKDYQAQAMFYACQILRESNGEELSFQQSIAANWVSHIFVAGNQEVYSSLDLMDILQGILRDNPDFPRIGQRRITEALRRYKRADMFNLLVGLNAPLDLKYHLYRPIEQFLTGLAEVHGLLETNCFDILTSLRSKELLSQDLADAMFLVLNYALKVGFKTQFCARSHVTSLEFSGVFENCVAYFQCLMRINELTRQREALKNIWMIRRQDDEISNVQNLQKGLVTSIQSRLTNAILVDDILYFYGYVRPTFFFVFHGMQSIVENRQFLEGRKDGAHQNDHGGRKTK